MPISKKYLHDHLILLLLSVNVFLALACSVLVTIRLLTSHGTGYIVQYRSNLGINAFKTGSVFELLSFIVFALLVVVIHTILSHRAYHIHRRLAIVILNLGVLLLALTIIVSNALLVLR